MNENELKHYGVLGMKWGRRKHKLLLKTSKEQNKDNGKEEKRNKAVKGAKIAATFLAVSGGIAVTALIAKKSREMGLREGRLVAQNEATMLRKAAAAKGVATKAANRAISSIGGVNIKDYMSHFH